MQFTARPMNLVVHALTPAGQAPTCPAPRKTDEEQAEHNRVVAKQGPAPSVEKRVTGTPRR